jgi:SAM-dependent methyltransferase
MSSLQSIIKTVIPRATRQKLREKQKRLDLWPPVGWVRFGSLRRLTPISRLFGEDRGLPIDRYYIEGFLKNNSSDIRGRVLEIGDNSYTLRFGGDKVTQSDILFAGEGNPNATIIGDLTNASNIPDETFDCFICTQTLLCIYDIKAAIHTIHRILKPGGVVLVTIPGISQIARYEMDNWGDYWRFTSLSSRRLFEEVFPSENVEVKAYGNVLTAIAFLHGLTVKELSQEELDYNDSDYEMLLTIRAVKPE